MALYVPKIQIQTHSMENSSNSEYFISQFLTTLQRGEKKKGTILYFKPWRKSMHRAVKQCPQCRSGSSSQASQQINPILSTRQFFSDSRLLDAKSSAKLWSKLPEHTLLLPHFRGLQTLGLRFVISKGRLHL